MSPDFSLIRQMLSHLTEAIPMHFILKWNTRYKNVISIPIDLNLWWRLLGDGEVYRQETTNNKQNDVRDACVGQGRWTQPASTTANSRSV